MQQDIRNNYAVVNLSVLCNGRRRNVGRFSQLTRMGSLLFGAVRIRNLHLLLVSGRMLTNVGDAVHIDQHTHILLRVKTRDGRGSFLPDGRAVASFVLRRSKPDLLPSDLMIHYPKKAGKRRVFQRNDNSRTKRFARVLSWHTAQNTCDMIIVIAI